MEKRSSALVIVALVLAALYAAFFTDWFRKQSIQIIVQHRPIAQRVDPKKNLEEAPVFPITFAFDHRYEFTSIKVVKADELSTSKFPTPLWHVVSETNSRPTKVISYGLTPAGMHPAVDDSQPQPLVAGTTYTLLLESKGLKGSTNFVPIQATLTR